MSAFFEKLTSVSELWAAAKRAARGKRGRPSVARTLFELESVVLRLERELRSFEWRPGVAQRHEIRDPKARRIAAAPFEDRIVHQSLCAAIGPALDRHLIGHTFACRTERGTHAALRWARVWARSYPLFVHIDVRKFFPTIDHTITEAQLARHVRCTKTLDLCAKILRAGEAYSDPVRFHFPGDDLFTPWARHVGLPIGNLTSQHFANRYLSPVDHHAKDRLRIRPYLRYMDDFLFFGENRADLLAKAREIEGACTALRLRVHPWEVRPTRAGVSFLGFHILPREMRVRRTTVKRAEKRLAEKLAAVRTGASPDEFAASLRATFAHFQHGTTYQLRTSTLRSLGILAGENTEVTSECGASEDDCAEEGAEKEVE